MQQSGPERFGPTSGRVAGWIAIGLVLVIAVSTLLDGYDDSDATVVCALALAGLVCWAVLLRPSLVLADHVVVLRNMFSTTRIPLALVEDVEVRHVTTVLAAGRSYLSTAVHRPRRSRRATLLSSHKAQQPGPPTPSVADLVVSRIRSRADTARAALRSGGAEPAAVSRTWDAEVVAPAVLLALAAIVLLFVP